MFKIYIRTLISYVNHIYIVINILLCILCIKQNYLSNQNCLLFNCFISKRTSLLHVDNWMACGTMGWVFGNHVLFAASVINTTIIKFVPSFVIILLLINKGLITLSSRTLVLNHPSYFQSFF